MGEKPAVSFVSKTAPGVNVLLHDFPQQAGSGG